MGEGEVGEGGQGGSHFLYEGANFRGRAGVCYFEGGEVHAMWWHEPEVCVMISFGQRYRPIK